MQNSAEYHACCLQTYRLAGERLKAKLATRPKDEKKAVILDLDETVFDTSAFQTWLYRNRLAYAQPLWDRWEKEFPGEVRLVPGAKEFIAGARQDGVTVVYISNRSEEYREFTVEALRHLGLDTTEIHDRLLLKTTTSNKSDRRKQVRNSYRVLMLLGDNLRDFSEEFKAPTVDPDDVPALRKALRERKEQVDRRGSLWGEEWFILPNPVYGEWTKLEGKHPIAVLNPSKMPGP
jgi:acid phosphatase